MYLQGGGGGALAVAGLEHIELAVLHGELHVLHVAVVVFQGLADLLKLLEGLGELVSHLLDGHGVARIVGLGALKYFILKVDARKNMTFNPKESIDVYKRQGPPYSYRTVGSC